MIRESYEKADFVGKTALVLSSWFGTGLMPFAPGTFGTLASLPVVMASRHLGSLYAAIFLFLFILLAVWASGLSRDLMGCDDPAEVVIDEVVGFLVSLFLVPYSWRTFAMAFVFFRVFDIWKPFPIKRLERLGGGVGIVLDDLMAGVYANLSLRILIFFFE